MAKRIEPLSSRAQMVDGEAGKPSREGTAATLNQPRRIDSPRRSSPGGKRKMTFWRRILLTLQICFVIFIIVAAIGGYFIYEKALVYYARAETYDLKKLDDLNVTSTFYDVNGEELPQNPITKNSNNIYFVEFIVIYLLKIIKIFKRVIQNVCEPICGRDIFVLN